MRVWDATTYELLQITRCGQKEPSCLAWVGRGGRGGEGKVVAVGMGDGYLSVISLVGKEKKGEEKGGDGEEERREEESLSLYFGTKEGEGEGEEEKTAEEKEGQEKEQEGKEGGKEKNEEEEDDLEQLWEGHSGAVTAIVYLSSFNHIWTSSVDGSIRSWQLSPSFTLSPLMTYIGHKHPVATLTNIGQRFTISGDTKGNLLLWSTSPDLYPDSLDSCQRLQRLFVATEKRQRTGVRGVFWREGMGREVWVSCGNAAFSVFSLRFGTSFFLFFFSLLICFFFIFSCFWESFLFFFFFFASLFSYQSSSPNRDELTLPWLLGDPYPSPLSTLSLSSLASPSSPLSSPGSSPLPSSPPFPHVPKTTFQKWMNPVIVDHPLELTRWKKTKREEEGEQKPKKRERERAKKRPNSSVGMSLMKKGVGEGRTKKKGGSQIGRRV